MHKIKEEGTVLNYGENHNGSPHVDVDNNNSIDGTLGLPSSNITIQQILEYCNTLSALDHGLYYKKGMFRWSIYEGGKYTSKYGKTFEDAFPGKKESDYDGPYPKGEKSLVLVPSKIAPI